MVVLRVKLTGEMLIAGIDDNQKQIAFVEGDVLTTRDEYSVLSSLAGFLSALKATAE
jgi:hypothetical protein